ncbi:MAG TPA: OmpA family protein [Chthoniobacteraceae bacterium]|nr:OmpA family protein [Chthoniobacteraceae bacterium]
MPEFRGRCTNTSGCQLAQEHRILSVSGEPRCPECGGPLQPAGSDARPIVMRIALALAGLAVFAGAVALGWRLSRQSVGPESPPDNAAAAASTAPQVPAEKTSVTAEERNEVLKRIDLVPNISAAEKERLYAFVERSLQIKRVMLVAFHEGKTRLTEAEIRKVEARSREPEFAKAARDPTTIFVVLGYADKHGEESKNVHLSLERATHVADLLRKRCGLQNLARAVPMGSSDLFDPLKSSQNRVAEVWTVVP